MAEGEGPEDILEAEASKVLDELTNQRQNNDDDDFDFERDEPSGARGDDLKPEGAAIADEIREDDTSEEDVPGGGQQAVAIAPGVEVGSWAWPRVGLTYKRAMLHKGRPNY